MNQGWICPKCGRALAPWVSECPCYIQPAYTTTNYGRSRLRADTLVNQTGKCDRVCENKTDLGYCRTTACIKPEYGGDPNFGIGNGA